MPVRCIAKTIQNRKCTLHANEGQKFCWIHSKLMNKYNASSELMSNLSLESIRILNSTPTLRRMIDICVSNRKHLASAIIEHPGHKEQLQALEIKFAQLEKQLQTCTSSKDHTQCTQNFDSITKEFQQLQTQHRQLIFTNSQLESNYAKIQSEVETCVTQKQEMDKKINIVKSELERTRQMMQVRVDTSDHRVVELESKLSRVVNLSSQLTNERARLQQLQNRLTTHNRDMRALRQKYNEVATKLRNNGRILESKLQNASESEQKALISQMESMARQEDKLSEIKADLTLKIQAQQTTLAKMQESLAASQKAQSDSAALIASYRAESEQCKKDKDQVISNLNAIQRQLHESEQSLKNLTGSREQITTTLNALGASGFTCSQMLGNIDSKMSSMPAETRGPLRRVVESLCQTSSAQLSEITQKMQKDASLADRAIQNARDEVAALQASQLALQQNKTVPDIFNVILAERQQSCGAKLASLTQALSAWPTLRDKQSELKSIVDLFCVQTAKTVGGPRAPVNRSQLADSKAPVPKAAVAQARAATFSAEELEQIAAKARNSAGIVRVLIRVRCSNEKSQAFTAGSDENGNSSVIRVAYGGSQNELKRKKDNLYLYNDNDHLNRLPCSDISGLNNRTSQFYRDGLAKFIDPQQSTTIIAYGQSGSGKTTIINHILGQLMDRFGDKIRTAQVAFADIYNEGVLDLLKSDPNTSKPLEALSNRRTIRNAFSGLIMEARVNNPTKKFEDQNLDWNIVKTPEYAGLRRQITENIATIKWPLEQITEEKIAEINLEKEYKDSFNGKYTALLDDDWMTGRYSNKNFNLTYKNVESKENYDRMWNYARSLRKVTITPQNTGGSSRSHLLIRFSFGDTIFVNFVDLAGSEDYSNIEPKRYGDLLAAAGYYIGTNPQASLKVVKKESESINSSLLELADYMKQVNASMIEKNLPQNREFKTSLVKLLHAQHVLEPKSGGSPGLISLVTTMKSDSDDASLEQAYQTIEMLNKLIPSDIVLDSLGAKK